MPSTTVGRDRVTDVLKRRFGKALAGEGKSMRRIARNAGTTAETISNLAAGIHEPKLSVFLSLCRELDMDANDVINQILSSMKKRTTRNGGRGATSGKS